MPIFGCGEEFHQFTVKQWQVGDVGRAKRPG